MKTQTESLTLHCTSSRLRDLRERKAICFLSCRSILSNYAISASSTVYPTATAYSPTFTSGTLPGTTCPTRSNPWAGRKALRSQGNLMYFPCKKRVVFRKRLQSSSMKKNSSGWLKSLNNWWILLPLLRMTLMIKSEERFTLQSFI